jgi:hypothetical protein
LGFHLSDPRKEDLAIKLALLILVDIIICERNELLEDDSLNSRDLHRFSNILDELGYVPVPSRADRILYDAAKRSIERFGQSASKAILDHMCSMDGSSKSYLQILTTLPKDVTQYLALSLLIRPAFVKLAILFIILLSTWFEFCSYHLASIFFVIGNTLKNDKTFFHLTIYSERH